MELTEEVVFEHLLENMTEGIFLVGYDGQIRMENTIAAELLNVNGDTLFGRTLVDILSENSMNDAFCECITLAVFEKHPVNEIVPFYLNEEMRLLRLVVSPLRDREENIAAIVMFSDVTELTNLGKQNEELNKKLIEFLDRFVTVLVNAIDKRSHFNATHTKKMVEYAMNYLEYLDDKGRGIAAEKRGPFLSSIWMHDVGKLVIPNRILEKPNRLADKIKEVRHRVEVSILTEKVTIAELSGKLETAGDGDSGYLINKLANSGEWINLESSVKEASKNADIQKQIRDAEDRIKRLEEAYKYIEEVNNRGFIDDDTKARVEEVAGLTCHTFDGNVIPLLDDYDVEALTVQRGNLTANERSIVESHVSETYTILKAMNFEGPYKDVPEWAGRHHEYLDGSGYPNGLSGDEITWESRILTIIDIYDALTAEDRPYKPAMSTEKAFDILRSMAEEGKIDGEILQDFYESGAYKITR